MSAFLCEAITEGEALRDLLDYYANEGRAAMDAAQRIFREGGYRRVVFAGMGSSYCAPFAVLDHLTGSGVPAVAVTAHKLVGNRATILTEDTMVVLISKSGATREILDFVDGAAGNAGLVAVVNQPESALARHCEVVLPIRAGSEIQIASKSYLCTLVDLNLLAAELANSPRRTLNDALREGARWAGGYLAQAATNSEPLVAALAGCTHVDILASGPSFGTAYKCALVLREVPRVMAAALDCADYAHGWAKTVHPDYAGIILAPEYHDASIEARVAGQILDRRGRVILITSSTVPLRDGLTVVRHPFFPEQLAPLVQAVICDGMIGAMPGLVQR